MSRTALFLASVMNLKNDIEFNFLPMEELEELINSDVDLTKYIIAANYDPSTNEIVCCRGDGKIVIINTNLVDNPHSNANRDLNNVRPTDYGCTLALGEFEAEGQYVLERGTLVVI